MSKTIVEKLNLTKYNKAAVLHAPGDTDYFQGWDGYDTSFANQPYDVIFAFVVDLESLRTMVKEVIANQSLNPNGYLFIAYPKKGNTVYPTYIHRDELLPGMGADEDGYVGSSTLKFSRMVGLDSVFTVVGLKEDSKGVNKVSTKPSSCVDDYIEFIPEIEKDLQDAPDLLAFYQALTPGYQKDWARYVYSAKQEATKAKRHDEMKRILRASYKSRDLYRRDN
ncbi:YdeI/OmpD-associated family protein [Sporosarcina sp. 179-K 3D1 HS]|uniref:YdeI/OmpD-associated family protein n=1 Tax=Sporosarcina sp. 179-K 3D1 HS TaxID=3232169 RepID=UPI0039A0E897